MDYLFVYTHRQFTYEKMAEGPVNWDNGDDSSRESERETDTESEETLVANVKILLRSIKNIATSLSFPNSSSLHNRHHSNSVSFPK